MKHVQIPLLLFIVLATAVLPGGVVAGSREPTTNILRYSVPDPDMASVSRLLSADSPRTLIAHAETAGTTAFREPSASSQRLATLTNPTDTGGPLVFPVLEADTDGWLKVRLPIRPNGSSGWIRASSVELSTNHYIVEIDTSEHRLDVLYKGELLLRTEVAIGTGSTPTPIGSFYLTELLKPANPNGIYGPFAFGLSGFSETLQSFNGGDGVIGLHGTNEPATLGLDVSHGCVRLHNDAISDLASFLPLGTPVTIAE